MTASATKRYARVAVTAPGVAHIPNLAAFLPEVDKIVCERFPGPTIDATAGWAARPSSRKARHIAQQRHIPYLALEDGFLRSVSLGQDGAPPMSLVLDATGLYFDAAGPSDLETRIETGRGLNVGLLAQAREAIAFKNRNRLSKYNNAPPLNLGPKARRRILIIDQTAGDASIAGGLADAGTFGHMLEAAQNDNPGGEIIVKIHPATAAGHCGGCIAIADAKNMRLLKKSCDPVALLEQVDAVYTVSSLAGFEALLLGLPVHCFGMPFYAGWGPTIDRVSCTRRTAKRSAEELFAAAYMLYARYVDPLMGKACSIFDGLERLALFKSRAGVLRGPLACYGFSSWKQARIRDVLGAADKRISFHRSAAAANRKARALGGRTVIWASRETPSNREALTNGGIAILRMEDGFLRSVGLGSDFHRASSFVLDDLGIYYDPASSSRLENILAHGVFDGGLLARAAALRAAIVGAGLSKYNIGSGVTDSFAGSGGKRKLLVVGQVEDDASIRFGCDGIATNDALLRVVRASSADAFIVYKDHPDVVAGNRWGRIAPDTAKLADRCIAAGNIIDCIEAASELHTMTSLAGFEALLRGKTVHVYGRPFYAGWGLTQDRLSFAGRNRRLTLDELVAGALILYPIYIDPVSRLPCTPEFHMARLQEIKKLGVREAPSRGFLHFVLRSLRAGRESLLTRPRARI